MKNNKRKKLPSILRWILWVLLIQFLLINISAFFYAYRLTHLYPAPPRGTITSSGNILTKTWRLFTGPRQFRYPEHEAPVFPFETLTLTTKKGISIDAWYGKSDSVSKGTVILFHGLTSNKSGYLPEANEFHYLGYNVMMIDFRDHGKSEGSKTTIGYSESEEVKLAYDYVLQKGEQNIFLWGSSMGAVAVSKAISDFSLQPSGIILEMPFGSLQSHLRGRARALGFPGQPFGFLVTFWIGVQNGFNGFHFRVADYAKKINCPVLLQWGALDGYVQRSETDGIFSAIPSMHKKLVIYDRAGHESMLLNEEGKWRTEVKDFLEEYGK